MSVGDIELVRKMYSCKGMEYYIMNVARRRRGGVTFYLTPLYDSDIEIQDPIALRRTACHPANLTGRKMATTVIFGAQT